MEHTMSADDYNKMSDGEKKKEDWMNAKWRPMMGWMYMLVCTMDFVVFPILWSILQAFSKGQVNVQWQPITLQGAGLFHIAMGAVLGLAAYGRTQEKLGGANNGGIQLPSNVGTTYVPPNNNLSTGVNNGSVGVLSASGSSTFGAPAAGGFGAASSIAPAATGFSSNPTVGTGAFGDNGFGSVTTGFGGKPAPVQPPQPLL